MNSLVLYPSDGGFFDSEVLLQILKNFDFVSELEIRPDEIAAYCGRTCLKGESNMFELKKNLRAFVLGCEGRSSISFAYEIQRQYPEPLTLTNESFSFEANVKEFSEPTDIEGFCMAQLNTE